MKTIIITGPSGSGKSYLSNKLSKLLINSIVIKSDAYYKDNILIQFLSIFLSDIYDRLFSIKKNELIRTLRSINNKDRLIAIFNYDFLRKHSSKSVISINYPGENQFLILEGIFAHRLNMNYHDTINIVCKEQKEICFQRRLKRDRLERGRNNAEVIKKFNKSWILFHQNLHNYLNSNKVIELNVEDKISYSELVSDLLKIQITKKNN